MCMIQPSTTSCSTITKGDNAASNHYFALQDKIMLLNIRKNNSQTTILLPNHSSLTSNLHGNMHITNTKLFHTLNHSLISLGQLCDDKCFFILAKTNSKVF